MQIPARRAALAIETFAIKPEAAAGLVLDPIIIAGAIISLLIGPPFGDRRSGPSALATRKVMRRQVKRRGG
jgi:hypothetical protein